MERTTQLLRGVLDMCLLALLAERECYGYEIVRRLDERGLEPVAEGTIYPALSRLTRAGLIEGHWATSPQGPRRKYYRLRPQGREQVRGWVDEWAVFRDAVDRVVSSAARRSAGDAADRARSAPTAPTGAIDGAGNQR